MSEPTASDYSIAPGVSTEALAAVSPDQGLAEMEAATPVAISRIGPGEYLSPSEPPREDTLWRAGTLTYTKAGIAVLFFWLLWGDFAWYMRDRSVGPTVQLFLKSLHASDFTMSMLLTFVPPGIGLIVTPIISYRSDRLRSRWGRRVPYLLIPTPFGVLAMIAIAYSVPLGEQLRHFIAPSLTANNATLIVFGIAWTVFEVVLNISGAVLGGLINDVVPRGRLGRFYGMFRSVSLVDGMIFNWFLLSFAETHFKAMFIGVAAVFGIGFTVMCLNVREGTYPTPEIRPDADGVGGFFAAVRIFFTECFSQPYYLWCFAAFTLGLVTFLPVNTFNIYYAKQLHMDMSFYGKLISISFFVSLCSAYVLGWLVDRFHSLRVGMASLALYTIAMVYGMLAIHDTRTFTIAVLAHTILSGVYWTATAPLTQALLPRSRFAQFASAGGILSSLATMAIGPSLGLILDSTGNHYRLIYAAGLIICIAAMLSFAVVYRKFLALGGIDGYVAPGDDANKLPVGPVVAAH